MGVHGHSAGRSHVLVLQVCLLILRGIHLAWRGVQPRLNAARGGCGCCRGGAGCWGEGLTVSGGTSDELRVADPDWNRKKQFAAANGIASAKSKL